MNWMLFWFPTLRLFFMLNIPSWKTTLELVNICPVFFRSPARTSNLGHFDQSWMLSQVKISDTNQRPKITDVLRRGTRRRSRNEWEGGKDLSKWTQRRLNLKCWRAVVRNELLKGDQRGNVYKNPRQPISRAHEPCETDHRVKWVWLTQMHGWK